MLSCGRVPNSVNGELALERRQLIALLTRLMLGPFRLRDSVVGELDTLVVEAEAQKLGTAAKREVVQRVVRHLE